MKKPKILRNKKNVKYGGYSLLLTAAFLVAIILINVLVTALSDRFNLQVDMTQTRKYSLSTQTNQILKNLDKDVYVYTLYATGAEDSDIMQILSMYRSGSNKVHVESIDMTKNPQSVQAFTQDGSTLQNTSIIVTNADKSRYRILTQYDQYEYSYDE
ncbi:MAG: Gldg family protein, partial [Eubacteriales bacterium]|nr:Gldg family protein [Eubacteriales bacterium]